MTRTVALLIFIVSLATALVLVAAAPWTLSDNNDFLRGFVNHEFLNFMGVVVAISIASGSNLYIELNKMEEREGVEIFPRSKRNVRDDVYALLWSLFFSVGVVVIKPLAKCGERSEAFFNAAAILLILFAALTLSDLIRAAFDLDPLKRKKALAEHAARSAAAATAPIQDAASAPQAPPDTEERTPQ